MCVCGGRVCNSGAGFDCLGKGFVGISFNAFFLVIVAVVVVAEIWVKVFLCLYDVIVGWLVSWFVRSFGAKILHKLLLYFS